MSTNEGLENVAEGSVNEENPLEEAKRKLTEAEIGANAFLDELNKSVQDPRGPKNLKYLRLNKVHDEEEPVKAYKAALEAVEKLEKKG